MKFSDAKSTKRRIFTKNKRSAITKIDEDKIAEVAMLVDPAVEDHLLANVFFSEGSCVRAVHGLGPFFRYSFLSST